MRDRIQALLARAQSNPNDDAALTELAVLLRAEREWATLSTVLAQRAAIATSDGDRATVWLEHARMCEIELGDLYKAETLYARAAEFDPNARVELERIREKLGPR